LRYGNKKNQAAAEQTFDFSKRMSRLCLRMGEDKIIAAWLQI